MKYLSDELAKSMRAMSLDAERNGQICTDALQMIYDQKLFKLFVPEEMNGALMGLPEAVRIFEEASYIDGSFGWLVTIGSGGSYFSGIFNKKVSERLFAPDNAVVAGSGYIGGVAGRVKGGYNVSGRWKFCSGADFATIFTANCSLEDGSVRSFIFTPDQVTVHRDWDTFGLKATGSHSISVDEAMVPDEMTFDIANGPRAFDAPIFHYPFLPFAEVSFAAVNIGICRHFMDEAKMATEVYNKPESKMRYERILNVVLEQESILNREVNKFHEAVEVSWELTLHRGQVPDAVYSEVGRWARNVTAASLCCAQKIYPYLGLAVATESHCLNRCWRDLHTASQHVLLKSFE